MKSTAVFWLIVANVAAYALQLLFGDAVEIQFALWPVQPIPEVGQSLFHFWQIVTYAFLHDETNLLHPLFNMLFLYMFGREIGHQKSPRRPEKFRIRMGLPDENVDGNSTKV